MSLQPPAGPRLGLSGFCSTTDPSRCEFRNNAPRLQVYPTLTLAIRTLDWLASGGYNNCTTTSTGCS